jgi:ubiquinone/menaquinone biosynthesis C-methylase UbiE
LTTTPDIDAADQPPFFLPGAADDYTRLPDTPYLLKRGGASLAGLLGDPQAAAEWREKQSAFIRWTRDPVMFNEADVAQNFALYRRFFEETWPRLAGRVLDIGGGWGLFRKWWQAGADGCFVVHDPGVERFTAEPPETLRRFFGDDLAKPCLFVEGFGESLPYRDGVYDVVLIASALDHCADPPHVIAAAHRVLRPGGRLLVIQGFEHEAGQAKPPGTSFPARLARVLADPRRLHRAIRMRLFHRGEPHMHHFTKAELRRMMEAAGLRDYTETVISERFGVLAIEAHKAN